MDDLFIKSVGYIKGKLEEANRTSYSNLMSKNFLFDNFECINTLNNLSRISLRKIRNLKNPKILNKTTKNKCLAETPELKQKKLKEKDQVRKKLKIELSMLQSNEILQTSAVLMPEALTIPGSEKPLISTKLSDTVCQTTSEKLKFCYVCKKTFMEAHFFYDQLCVDCSCINYAKRTQSCNFSGFVAVVTGCRIKIGYEICLYLLRNSCFVIGTTRFAKECFLRYQKEPDFEAFKARLRIYSLDLRDLSSLQQFARYLYKNYEKIDILINNAAQTLRRNPKFYENVLNIETNFSEINNSDAETIIVLTKLSVNSCQNLAASSSQIQLLPSDFFPNSDDFPVNILDKDGQQVDLTKKSSWKLEIDEVHPFEFVETQIINSWSPFFLCSMLKNLFLRKTNFETTERAQGKFIVNVSSMKVFKKV